MRFLRLNCRDGGEALRLPPGSSGRGAGVALEARAVYRRQDAGREVPPLRTRELKAADVRLYSFSCP